MGFTKFRKGNCMRSEDYEYGMDPQGRLRFYGIYSAKVVDITDPLQKSRIKVQVQQATGNEVTAWAVPCLPITSNAEHPDHLTHTAAQVAALLNTHATHNISVSGTTDSGGVTEAHSHSFSASTTASHAAHSGNSGELTHAHVTVTDPQETDTIREHTPHRIVPRLNQKVWVMFVAGDPEYPVWIGVQS